MVVVVVALYSNWQWVELEPLETRGTLSANGLPPGNTRAIQQLTRAIRRNKKRKEKISPLCSGSRWQALGGLLPARTRSENTKYLPSFHPEKFSDDRDETWPACGPSTLLLLNPNGVRLLMALAQWCNGLVFDDSTYHQEDCRGTAIRHQTPHSSLFFSRRHLNTWYLIKRLRYCEGTGAMSSTPEHFPRPTNRAYCHSSPGIFWTDIRSGEQRTRHFRWRFWEVVGNTQSLSGLSIEAKKTLNVLPGIDSNALCQLPRAPSSNYARSAHFSPKSATRLPRCRRNVVTCFPNKEGFTKSVAPGAPTGPRLRQTHPDHPPLSAGLGGPFLLWSMPARWAVYIQQLWMYAQSFHASPLWCLPAVTRIGPRLWDVRNRGMHCQSRRVIDKVADWLRTIRRCGTLRSGGFPQSLRDFAGWRACEKWTLQGPELVVQRSVEWWHCEGVSPELE